MTETPIEIIDQAWVKQMAAKASATAPNGGPIPIGVIAGEVVERLSKTLGQTLAQNPARPLRFRMVEMLDIAAKRDTRYLVKNVIPAGALIVLWGRPKCGK